MQKVTLKLPYPPSSNVYWGTRVVTSGGRSMSMTYVTHEARGYKKQVLALARAAGINTPLLGRVQIEIWLYPNRPQDWEKRQRKHGDQWDDTVRCIDLDNANKVLLDALKDVVMEDDKFVFRCAPAGQHPEQRRIRPNRRAQERQRSPADCLR